MMEMNSSPGFHLWFPMEIDIFYANKVSVDLAGVGWGRGSGEGGAYWAFIL